MSFKLIGNHLSPAEGETTVRTYHCTSLSPVFAVIGLKIAGYLTITNKRVVYFATGSSLFGLEGKSKLYNEVPIADVANLSLGQGTRFSVLRLIGAIIVSIIVGGIIAALQSVVLPLLGFNDLSNPYKLRLGICLQLFVAIWLFLSSQRFSREDGVRFLLASCGLSLLGSILGYAATHRGALESLPALYFVGMAIVGIFAVCFWLCCLYWFIRREYLTMTVSSKSGYVKPIRIFGVSWLGRINVAADFARGMAPAADAAVMFKELGAIVTDIQTLGDHGVEKWAQIKTDVQTGGVIHKQQDVVYGRTALLGAVTAMLLIGVLVSGESVWYSISAKRNLAVKMRNDLANSRIMTERDVAVRQWVPKMVVFAEHEADVGETEFAKNHFDNSMQHWSKAINTYAKMPAAATAMKNASIVQSKYDALRHGVYVQESVTERLKGGHLMADFTVLMKEHPNSNDDWKVVNLSLAKAKVDVEQDKWGQAGMAWDYAGNMLPPSVQLMRADLWVTLAEKAIKRGDAHEAYSCTLNALTECPLYSCAKQRQELAVNMMRYSQQFFAAITNGSVNAINMEMFIVQLDLHGGADWAVVKSIADQAKTLANQNEWEKCSSKWKEALSKLPVIILAMQMKKIESEARLWNWGLVSSLANNVLSIHPDHKRAVRLKEEAESIMSAYASERAYQQTLSNALVREVASDHVTLGDMSDFTAHMDQYGHEEWAQVKEAIKKAEDLRCDERGSESSSEWMKACAQLPAAVKRMRAEIWMERAEQEVVKTNWSKVLVYSENALKEMAEHIRAKQLRDQADGIEEMKCMREKYDQLFKDAVEHMTNVGCKTNEQTALFTNLAKYGGIPWDTTQSNIKKANEFEKHGQRTDCVASWTAVFDLFPLAIQEMRAGYWVEKAEKEATSKHWAKVSLYIDNALKEMPDHVRAKQLKNRTDGVETILTMRNKFDQMLSNAADKMPDMGGAVGDRNGLVVNLAKYGGASWKLVEEKVAKAAELDKQERLDDCIDAWRLVIDTCPVAIRNTRAGYWLAKAENDATNKVWSKVSIEVEKALFEDPENTHAKALKSEAEKNSK